MNNLAKILYSFDRDLVSIDHVFQNAIGYREPNLFRAAVEWYCIRLQDLWAYRVRVVVLQSAMGNASTANGVHLPKATGFATLQRAMRHVQRTWTKNGKVLDEAWEPKWYDPSQAIRVATILSCANVNQISTGLGTSTSPIDLRTVRNAIVHNSPASWKQFAVLKQKHVFSGSPVDFALRVQPAIGLSNLSVWKRDLRAALEMAVQ